MTLVKRVVGWHAVLLAVFLLAGICAYTAYLTSEEVPDVEGPPASYPPPARRIVVFVLDAFHPARAFDRSVMPNLVQLAAEGASGIVRTGPVSTTAPCVFTLMTGRSGNLVQAVLNFHSREVRGPSLPRDTVRAGRRIALSGDKTWTQQFGWLAQPGDLHVSAELGITMDPRITASDVEAVEFLLGKLKDPGLGLLVVHVDSTDAIGHLVTPQSERYFEQLHFFDGLIGEVARAAGAQDTLLLVTGDHGMGARGSHGGAEEEARLTPYVLRGPGVKPGVVRDIPQSGLAPTLAVLLGLPQQVVSEHPPLTELLTISPEAAHRLRADYLDAKAAAAHPHSAAFVQPADAPAGGEAMNDRLNAALFGSGNPHRAARGLTVLVTMLGVIAALAMCRSGAPRVGGHWAGDFVMAAAPLFALAATGSFFLRPKMGENLPYKMMVSGVDVGTVLAMTGAASFLLSERLRHVLGHPRPAPFFAVLVIASAPLLGSPWRSPARLFEALLFATIAILVFLWRSRIMRWAPVLLAVPAGLAVLHYLPGSGGTIPQWVYLSPLSAAILGLAGWNLRAAGRRRGTLGFTLLCLAFAAAWLWRANPVPLFAALVLATSLAGIAAAVLMGEPLAAATLVITGSASLFLMMADFGREALVFLAASTGALVGARGRLDLSQPRAVYMAAAVAILLRLCLFFQLGDEYMVSGIRTAAGFRLADVGLPLATVTALLLLKYTLPWFIILAAGLPSLARAGRGVARQIVFLIALGYAARLALVAAVADPLRLVVDGVQVLVGVFSISWAEFLTFTFASTLVVLLVELSTPAPSEPVDRASYERQS